MAKKFDASRPVDELFRGKPHISVRARNICKRLNVQTAGDFANYTEAELLDMKNAEAGTLTYIKRRLRTCGVRLKKVTEIDPMEKYGDALLIPIDEAFEKKPHLYVRAVNLLESQGVETVGGVTELREKDILTIRHCGRGVTNYIQGQLGKYNLSLAD